MRTSNPDKQTEHDVELLERQKANLEQQQSVIEKALTATRKKMPRSESNINKRKTPVS